MALAAPKGCQSCLGYIWGAVVGDYPGFRQDTRVQVTLPDGKTRSFKFQPTTTSDPFGLIQVKHPNFVAEPGTGTNDRLTVPDVPLIYLSEINEYVYFGDDLRAYNPADPYFGGKLALTTQDGLTYEIDINKNEITAISNRVGSPYSCKAPFPVG